MTPLFDAIASPRRLAILRHLDEAPNSSAPELSRATGLHLNTVRVHLRALEAAGIAERGASREGKRGRPTVRYRLRRSNVPEGEQLRPLTSLLAEALTSLGAGAEATSRSHGAEWGRRWSRRRPDEAPSERVRSALERLGFAVAIEADCVRLSECPCPLIAAARPQLVCGLADAVTDGVLEGSSLRATSRWHDPKRRRCSTVLVSA